MTRALIVYNALVISLVLARLSRLDLHRLALPFVLLSGLLAVLSVCAALLTPVGDFAKILLLAWAVLAPGLVFLLGTVHLSFGCGRLLFTICIALAVCLLLVGLDAFLIEPRWLEVTHITLPSDGLEVPLRVALVADLQADAIRRYEERVFELLAAEQPDLVLLAGDYLQIADGAAYASASSDLNALIRRSDLAPALGIFAVQGNVDRPDWPALFTGLPVTPFHATTSLDLGPLVLTGLTLEDSLHTTLRVDAREKFHLVLGHSPNYSLGHIDADLLLAGHTHGGQVRLPLLGPILTVSQVPRSWASGVTEIAPGKTLIVSRGVGMARGYAPRVRFLCRPELAILDLVPSE